MFLVPPALLLAAAHFTDLLSGPAWYVSLIIIWLLGMAAVALSRWSPATRVFASLAYTAATLFALPFLALIAVCTTGDCV